MTKPDTRQEMAEWIAEKVLGWKSRIDSHGTKLWSTAFEGCNECGEPSPGFVDCYLVRIIHTPAVFFAVWDAVEGRLRGTNLLFRHIPENGNVYCTLTKQYPHDEWEAKTKDRYDAFYSAVWDAMNNKEVKP